jgi:hypothetical protein
MEQILSTISPAAQKEGLDGAACALVSGAAFTGMCRLSFSAKSTQVSWRAPTELATRSNSFTIIATHRLHRILVDGGVDRFCKINRERGGRSRRL